MSDGCKFRIGDIVRPMESTIASVGEIVNLRDDEYVIVQWMGSNRSTHHTRSLELIARCTAASALPLALHTRH